MHTFQSLIYRSVVGALVIFVAALKTSPCEAARSSTDKPREIVVVGSKIKEVVKEAGLDITDQAVMSLSQNLVESVHEAFRRAERNRRYELAPLDLSCPERPSVEDVEILNEGILIRFIPELGFEMRYDFLPSLNAKANRMLGVAMERATANTRDTIEAYDF